MSYTDLSLMFPDKIVHFQLVILKKRTVIILINKSRMYIISALTRIAINQFSLCFSISTIFMHMNVAACIFFLSENDFTI